MIALADGDFEDLCIESLERMAFMVVDPIIGQSAIHKMRHVRVEFKSHDRWAILQLSGSAGFLCELAGNLLGEDPLDMDDGLEGAQALLELGNIIAGEVVMALGGEQERFNLGLPATDTTLIKAEQGADICWLESAGELMRACLICVSTDTEARSDS